MKKSTIDDLLNLTVGIGVAVTALGLFGVWFQGVFYENSMLKGPTVEEVRAAFTWPTACTTAGGIICTAGLLASPMTSSWPMSKRLVTLIVFAGIVILTCVLCGFIASNRLQHLLTD